MGTPHHDCPGGPHPTSTPAPLADLAQNTVTAALATLAAARVTRLITRDDFPVAAVRDWSLTRFGEHGWLPRLLECPWCTGVWVAVPATFSAYRWGRRPWWRRLAGWMALAMVSSAVVVLTQGNPPTVVIAPPDPEPDPDTEQPSDTH